MQSKKTDGSARPKLGTSPRVTSSSPRLLASHTHNQHGERSTNAICSLGLGDLGGDGLGLGLEGLRHEAGDVLVEELCVCACVCGMDR